MYSVSPMRKLGLLSYFLYRRGNVSLNDKSIIIFVRTKDRGERVSAYLQENKFSACYIHSDLNPAKRHAFLEEFRNGHLKILVSTDLLARGIDLPDVDAVVNLDLPLLPEDYLHRVGRTGRAGKQGVALTFVSTHSQVMKVGSKEVLRNEEDLLEKIEGLLGDQKLQRRDKVPGPWVDAPGVRGSTSKGHFDEEGVWVERKANPEPESYRGWIPNATLREEEKRQHRVEREKRREGKETKKAEESQPLAYDKAVREGELRKFKAQKIKGVNPTSTLRLDHTRNQVYGVSKPKKSAGE